MRVVVEDLRTTLRGLTRQPAFAAVAVLILALGIGANTTVFSVVDAILLRPLPYRDSDRLVLASSPRSDAFVERLEYRDWKFQPLPALTESSRFGGVAAAIGGDVTLGGATAVRVRGAAVSPTFFATLGVRAVIGRLFDAADVATTRRVAVISERLWRGRFGGARDVLGQSLGINDQSFVVTGVVPQRVQLPNSPDVWIPSGVDPQLGGEGPAYLVVLRLRDGVSLPEARTELARVFSAYWTTLPTEGQLVRVSPLRDTLAETVRPVLLLIAACAAMVLLVSCLNIASLLSIRVSAREREFAVRRAIGASRWRLARHVLLESLVLSMAGALVAVPAAMWMAAGARTLLPVTLHGAADIGVDARAFGAAVLLALVTAVLSAAVPSIALSRRSWMDTARGLGPSASDHPAHSRLRTVLVIVQIAAALVLLGGALTVVRKVAAVMSVDLGARGENALVMQLELPRTTYRDREGVTRFYRRIEDELGRVPGVRDVGATTYLPGTYGKYVLDLHIEGLARSPRTAFDLACTPGYFAAIGIDLVAGRLLGPGDGLNAPRVAVASVGVARAFGLEPGDLVGRRIDLSPAMPSATWAEIVGVVARDLRMGGAEDRASPTVYVPFEQRPPTLTAYLVIRSVGRSQGLVPAVRAAAARVDPNVPLYNMRSFDEVRAASLADRRLVMTLMLALGGIAILQAAVGLYGVMSYAVQRRRRELGIRIALGASPGQVRANVLLAGATLAGGGIGVGAVASFSLWRLVSGRITNLGTLDWSSVAVVGVGILLVALVAAWLPARRATFVDPVSALRAE